MAAGRRSPREGCDRRRDRYGRTEYHEHSPRCTPCVGYDIDEWSVDNAKDNLLLNGMGTAQVEVRLGNASVLKDDDQADLLIANINRNILLADMQTFAGAIDKRNGRLLLSGFYQKDISLLLQAAASNHLHLVEQKTDDNWAMLVFAKNISSDSQNKAQLGSMEKDMDWISK